MHHIICLAGMWKWKIIYLFIGEVFLSVLVFTWSSCMTTLAAIATRWWLSCSTAPASTSTAAPTSATRAVYTWRLNLVRPLEVVTLALFAFVKLSRNKPYFIWISENPYLPWFGPSFLTVSRMASLLHEHLASPAWAELAPEFDL